MQHGGRPVVRACRFFVAAPSARSRHSPPRCQSWNWDFCALDIGDHGGFYGDDMDDDGDTDRDGHMDDRHHGMM
jgi:hypothetical protein